MTIEQSVRRFLAERFPGYDDAIATDTPLDGIVDSLGLFDLVSFLETEYSLKFPPAEFSPELFRSIGEVVSVVRRYGQP